MAAFNIDSNANRMAYNVDLGALSSYEPGQINRLRLDPTASTATDISLDRLDVISKAIETAWSWEFNKTGDLEGWINYQSTVGVLSGNLAGTATGSDPKLCSPPVLNINGDTHTQLLVKMMVTAGDSAEVFFLREADTIYHPSRKKTFFLANNTDSVLYNLSMNEIPTYSGIIKRMRIDPTTDKNAEFTIDYVRVLGPVVSGSPEWRFETEGDMEGWLAKLVSSATATNGMLSVTTSAANSQIISPAGLGIDADAKSLLGIRMKAAAGTSGSLAWDTNGDGFMASRTKGFALIDNENFHTYYLELSGESGYTGTLNRLRIVVTNASGADVEIDWIGFL